MPGKILKIERQRLIYDLLFSRKFTVHELVEKLAHEGHAVSNRTVQSDINALKKQRIEISITGKGSRTQYQARSGGLPWVDVKLTDNEISSLRLLRIMHGGTNGNAVSDALSQILIKVEAKLPPEHRKKMSANKSHMDIKESSYFAVNVNLDDLWNIRDACEASSFLQIVYESALTGDKRRIKIAPRRIIFHETAPYLLAINPDFNEIRTYAISRISQIEVLDETHQFADFELDRQLKISFGIIRATEAQSIRLVFGKEIAPYIMERRWHWSEKKCTMPDGRLEMTIEVGITPELVQFICRFSDQVVVLEPLELKRAIACKLRSALGQYFQDDG